MANVEFNDYGYKYYNESNQIGRASCRERV